MNKKIITQMWNERRSNVALFIELLLVSVVLWWVVDAFYVRGSIYSKPRGFDSSHTYLITLDRFSDKHPDYHSSYRRDEWRNMTDILDRIRQRPDVEAACLEIYSHPYSEVTSWQDILYDTISTPVQVRNYIVGPGFFRVFRIQGFHGETPEQLEERFKERGVMLSSRFLNDRGVRPTETLNKSIRSSADSTLSYKVVSVLKSIRNNDYEEDSRKGFFLSRFYDTWVTTKFTICVRVKPGQDPGFIARFWEDAPKYYQQGNVFVRKIDSFSSLRKERQKFHEIKNTIYSCVMWFLFVNVCIALLGTFWYRTRQRQKEIALQMAMGSSCRQVFTRLISEGLWLLVFATLPAMLVDYQLLRAGMAELPYQDVYFTPVRYFVSVGIAFLMLVSIIVLSILYPAYYATKIAPAEALQEE